MTAHDPGHAAAPLHSAKRDERKRLVAATGIAALARAKTARRLGPAHFAWMRALAQGVPATESWQRYLALEDEAGDARTVASTLAWIRAELAKAAKKHDRFGVAHLVRLDVTRLGAREAALPTLEEFAQEHGLEDERE